MIASVLVVCVGNICRSPVGAQLLAQACPQLIVASAGISALEGHGPDKQAAAVAAQANLCLKDHVARQFTAKIAAEYDLILALEKGHMRVIVEQAPAASGKTMLLGQWLSEPEIADPYQKSREFHKVVFNQISSATSAWAIKLGGR